MKHKQNPWPALLGSAAILLILSAALPTPLGAAEKDAYGVPAGDALGPVGGGKGYAKAVAKRDYVVKSAVELMDALFRAASGQVIYVDDKAEIDMSVLVAAYQRRLVIPEGVTLASGRGQKGSQGGMIYSDEFRTSPLIEVGGKNVRISGLRLGGPDPKVRAEDLAYLTQVGRKTTGDKSGNGDYYRFPASDGIVSIYAGLEVDNCEIGGWSHAGVYGHAADSAARVTMHVHHCNIHHCQRDGLGYGVSVGDGCEALVEANLFDYTRHAIAGTGTPVPATRPATTSSANT